MNFIINPQAINVCGFSMSYYDVISIPHHFATAVTKKVLVGFPYKIMM